MKKSIWFLLLSMGAVACRTQQATEKLKYQLVESILEDLPSPFVYAKRSSDGRYHRQPPMATDTPVVRLLLLDCMPSNIADYQDVLDSGVGHTKKYFTPADMAYMRRQLLASEQFKLEQAKIREPWVTVIPLDTVTAWNKRLGRLESSSARDSLFQRYGSDKTFAIWGFLLSKDHKRALVNIDSDGRWLTCVYRKIGRVWRREAVISEAYE